MYYKYVVVDDNYHSTVKLLMYCRPLRGFPEVPFKNSLYIHVHLLDSHLLRFSLYFYILTYNNRLWVYIMNSHINTKNIQRLLVTIIDHCEKNIVNKLQLNVTVQSILKHTTYKTAYIVGLR